jgi:hypothetical protein
MNEWQKLGSGEGGLNVRNWVNAPMLFERKVSLRTFAL